MSGCVEAKALQEDLESLGAIPSLTKPEMKKGLGDEGPAYNMTDRNE